MTRKFNIHYTCQHCKKQTTAETAFGRWMRAHPALDVVEGIVRTDADHIVLRYKTSTDGRDFQLLMIVEVKEHGAAPDDCQKDILNFTHRLCSRRGENLRGVKTVIPIRVLSRVIKRHVLVRYYGVHLLQFENTNPDDSKWIKWDEKPITPEVLVGVLAMERNPEDPKKFMIEFLRDRHRKPVKHPELPLEISQ